MNSYFVDRFETNMMGRPCVRNEGTELKIGFNNFSLKKRDNLRRIKAGRRIILEWIIKK